MRPTTVTDDVALLAVLLGVLAIGVLVVHVTLQTLRALEPARPPLPEDDCAPVGLGRLVPVGSQVEQECRRGLVALELWLAAHRRRSSRPALAERLPRQRDAEPTTRESASEAG